MDKETLIRLAQPAATALLAISIATVPLIAKASGILQIEGSSANGNYSHRAIHVKIIK